jgi:hypothetical protein
MELNYMKDLPQGGFDFSNCLRNKALETNGNITIPHRAKATGTTIVGIKWKVSYPSSISWSQPSRSLGRSLPLS